MKTRKTPTVSNAVMEQIKHGKVTMRSRLFFTLTFTASIAGVVLAGVAIAYLFSLMTFWIKIETADTMAWGARANLGEALATFPWWILPVILALLIAAAWLIRQQGTMYRYKTWVIALVLVALSLIVGTGMSYLGIGDIHGSDQQMQHGQGWRMNQ